MVDLLLEQFQVFNNRINEVAAALKKGNLVLHEGNLALKEGQPCVYSDEEVFQELENLGVEEVHAYNFITSNPGLVRAFFGCPTHRHKAWLVEKMCASSNTCEVEYEFLDEIVWRYVHFADDFSGAEGQSWKS